MTTLVPQLGSPWLSVSTVIQKAATEFACVVTDEGRAMKLLAQRLVVERPDVDQQTADQLLKPLAEAVELICADDPHAEEAFLKCLVLPERPMEVVYCFDGHQAAAADLLERLARTLGYIVNHE